MRYKHKGSASSGLIRWTRFREEGTEKTKGDEERTDEEKERIEKEKKRKIAKKKNEGRKNGIKGKAKQK